MKNLIANPRRALLLVLFLAALGLAGCSSTESDNASVRPWNSPNGWGNGLPPGMSEGR